MRIEIPAFLKRVHRTAESDTALWQVTKDLSVGRAAAGQLLEVLSGTPANERSPERLEDVGISGVDLLQSHKLSM